MSKKTVKITSVSSIAYMPLSESTVYFSWSGKNLSRASGYTITWYVQVRGGGSKWYTKETQSVSGRTNTTWEPPTEALSIYANVKPSGVTNSKSYKTGSGKNSAVFTRVTRPKVTTPTLQTPVIEDGVLKLRVENYSDTYGANRIYFEVSINDGTSFHVGTVTYNARTGVASVNYNVTNGNRYKARVMALAVVDTRNSDYSAFSSNVDTIPPKVGTLNDIEALKGENDSHPVKLSWSAVSNAVTYKIDYATDESHLITESDDIYHDQTETNVTERIITSNIDPGHTFFFRVRATNSAGDGPWSDIKSIIVGTKPNPPTIWSYETIAKIGDQVILCFSHNSADSSKMSAAQIVYRVDGEQEDHVYNFTPPAEEDPTKVVNSFSWELDTTSFADSSKIYWKVRTKGIADEWGEYSAEKFFSVYMPPSVNVLIGEDYEWEDTDLNSYKRVSSYPLRIVTSSSPQSQTPIALILSIISEDDYDISMADGTEIHVASGETIWQEYYPISEHDVVTSLGAGEIFLNDYTKYILKVSVTMSNGLSAENSNHFITDWEDTEYNLDADIALDDVNYAVMIHPYAEDDDGYEITEGLLLSIYRRDVDGTLVEIATGIDVADNVTITDIHPALDYARYRIVGISKTTGLVTFEDLEGDPIGYKGIVIQWSEGWQEVDEGLPDFDTTVEYMQEARVGSILKLPYNVDVSDSPGKDVALVNYVGRSYPVSFYGVAKSLTSSWSTDVPKKDTETMHAIKRLANYQGNCYVREPNGSGYWAVITVTYSYTHNTLLVPVRFNITRVEGGA